MDEKLIMAIADCLDRTLPVEQLRGRPTKNFWVKAMLEVAIDDAVQVALDEEVRAAQKSDRENLLKSVRFLGGRCAASPTCHEEDGRAIEAYFDSITFGR